MFTLMDTDNNGKVTYEELKAGLQKVGSQLAEPEIKLLMEVVNILTIRKLRTVSKNFSYPPSHNDKHIFELLSLG